MNIEGFSILLGMLLPPFVDFVNAQLPKKRAVKFGVALLSSVIVGFISTIIRGTFDSANLLSSIGTAFTASQIVYNSYWRGAVEKRAKAFKAGDKVSELFKSFKGGDK